MINESDFVPASVNQTYVFKKGMIPASQQGSYLFICSK